VTVAELRTCAHGLGVADRPGPPGRRARLLAELRGVYIIWYRDLLRWWRDRQRILPSLVQPVLYLFVFGVGLNSAFSGGAAGAAGGGSAAGALGVSYTTFMYPGVLAMSVLFTSIFSAMSIVWDREFGFLKEIQVSPLSRAAVAVGKALGGGTVALLQASLLLLLGPLVGVWLSPLALLHLVGLLLLLAFTLSSVGVAVASRMRSMEGFQMVMNFLMLPLLLLSGAFFPLRGLPAWLAVLTHLDPAAYAVDALRRVALASAGAPPERIAALALAGPGGAPLPVWADVAALAAFAIPALALGVRWFGRAE
jgi:ABC-2 type transport system permease protein